MEMPKEIFLHLHNDPDEEFPWTWSEDDFHEDSTRYVRAPEGSVVLTAKEAKHVYHHLQAPNASILYDPNARERDVEDCRAEIELGRAIEARLGDLVYPPSEPGTDP